MTKTLEQYVAEATNAYAPSTSAVQQQLDSLSGQLDTTNEQINRNYAQQQASLDRSKNSAASQASMNAAHTGGAFGGAANIANRKYYEQTYVPAVTQMQTNQANELSSARQASEDTRNSLNSQLASLQSQANQQALSQYYSDLEAEKDRELQRETNAATNAYNNYLMQAAQEAKNQAASQYSVVKNDNGYYFYSPDNSLVRLGEMIANDYDTKDKDFNGSLYQVLSEMASGGDSNASIVLNQMNNGVRFQNNQYGTWGSAGSTGNSVYDALGIKPM